MVSFPYHSHIFRDSYGSGMGIVWEADHKGVPFLGVPGITLELVLFHPEISGAMELWSPLFFSPTL